MFSDWWYSPQMTVTNAILAPKSQQLEHKHFIRRRTSPLGLQAEMRHTKMTMRPTLLRLLDRIVLESRII